MVGGRRDTDARGAVQEELGFARDTRSLRDEKSPRGVCHHLVEETRVAEPIGVHL